MSNEIPLHQLNQHLFASLLPATHGDKPAPEEEAKPKRKAKPDADAPAAPDAE